MSSVLSRDAGRSKKYSRVKRLTESGSILKLVRTPFGSGVSRISKVPSSRKFDVAVVDVERDAVRQFAVRIAAV